MQRRISAVERSLRAALETLACLRKVGQALSPGNPAEVGRAILSPAKNASQPVADPPATPSKETVISEFGSVPEIPILEQIPRSAPLPLNPPNPELPPAGLPEANPDV